MEEGPEPQEWVERAAEEHHHSHEHESPGHSSAMMSSAITAAILAVFAAVGSLLSGHAANEAILAQMKATDQWAYYQAKSTKSHIYEASGSVVKALLETLGTTRAEESGAVLQQFQGEATRYDHEKEAIKHAAEALEARSRHEFRKHHRHSLGIAAFQVGIVLASVSILVRFRPLHCLSLAAGVVGLVFVFLGLTM